MCVTREGDLSRRTTHLADLFGRPQPSSVIVCAPCLTISAEETTRSDARKSPRDAALVAANWPAKKPPVLQTFTSGEAHPSLCSSWEPFTHAESDYICSSGRQWKKAPVKLGKRRIVVSAPVNTLQMLIWRVNGWRFARRPCET